VNIFVDDVDKNIEYFTQTLGATEVERTAVGGNSIHGLVAFGRGTNQLGIGLASIGMVTESATAGMEYDFGEFGENVQNSRSTLGNGVFLRIGVPNVDKFYEKINAKGAIIDEEPTDQAWGERTISVRTPDGYYLTFAQPIKGWKPDPTSGVEVIRGGTKGTTTRRTTTSGKKKR
jgi:catechol 2,3-dioxygenase-like lactoylglutathione lyase family enzyme